MPRKKQEYRNDLGVLALNQSLACRNGAVIGVFGGGFRGSAPDALGVEAPKQEVPVVEVCHVPTLATRKKCLLVVLTILNAGNYWHQN